MRGFWRRPRKLGTVLCAFLVAAALPGHAQVVDDNTRNAARNLAAQGKAAFVQGHYAEARDLLHRAYTLVPAPTIANYEGRALENLHRLVEAEEAYMRAVRTSLDAQSSEQFRDAVRDGENQILALRPRIPKVTIALVGPGANDPNIAVSLDGGELSSAVIGTELQIDPGDHQVTVLVSGAPHVEQSFSVVEGETKRVELAIVHPAEAAQPPIAPPEEAAAPRAPTTPRPEPGEAAKGSATPTQKIVALAVGGLGVSGLAVGLVAGIVASSRHSDAERLCANNLCVAGSDGANAVQSFHTLRSISTIGYVVGGAGIIGGVSLWLTAPTASRTQALTIRPCLGGATLSLSERF